MLYLYLCASQVFLLCGLVGLFGRELLWRAYARSAPPVPRRFAVLCALGGLGFILFALWAVFLALDVVRAGG
jgi:hypothetical protein